jgi:hypothetical protein
MPTTYHIGCATFFSPDLPPNSASPEAPGGTRLITDSEDKQVWSAVRETDTKTALSRGLAEYLRGLTIEFNGTQYAFERVFANYPNTEDLATYPSAIVYTIGDGQYDSTGFSPKVNHQDRIPDHFGGGFDPKNGRYIQTASELVYDLKVEIWANANEERQALVAMLEDALVPVDWRFGPLLELPHYHNARASYEKITLSYDDSEIDATRRYRRATITVRGKIPVVKVVQFGNFDAKRPVRLEVDVEES